MHLQPDLQPNREPDLYIDNLGTAPFLQRHGIASALMSKMLLWGPEQGFTYAWVATEMENDAATAFYAAQNFVGDKIALFGLQMD